MRMHETYYTPEQLAQLEARREEVGEDQIAAIEREWAELSAQMKAHRDAGTDPSDPEVRALAERWRDLTERTIAGFTGGDPGITESLGRMYKEEGPEKASRGTFDADLLEYLHKPQLRIADARTEVERVRLNNKARNEFWTKLRGALLPRWPFSTSLHPSPEPTGPVQRLEHLRPSDISNGPRTEVFQQRSPDHPVLVQWAWSAHDPFTVRPEDCDVAWTDSRELGGREVPTIG